MGSAKAKLAGALPWLVGIAFTALIAVGIFLAESKGGALFTPQFKSEAKSLCYDALGFERQDTEKLSEPQFLKMGARRARSESIRLVWIQPSSKVECFVQIGRGGSPIMVTSATQVSN